MLAGNRTVSFTLYPQHLVGQYLAHSKYLINSFINLFNKYLLSCYYIPSTTLITGDTDMNATVSSLVNLVF